MGKEKMTSNQIERMKKLLERVDYDHNRIVNNSNGLYGSSGKMGSSGNMGKPYYPDINANDIKKPTSTVSVKSNKREVLDGLLELKKDFPKMFDFNIKNIPTGTTVNQNSRIIPGNHLDEDYYIKWCGYTGNDTKTIENDNTRDIIKHNIQELTPRVEKIKHKWKFWRK